MDKELRIALQEKERLEAFLSNLERLHNDKTINDSSYTALKGEYAVNLRKEAALIEQIKQDVDNKLQVRTRELSVYKQELANLDARHKVGQISADHYFRTAKTPEKKIAALESTVAHLTSMLHAAHSSDITVMEEGGLASLLNIKALLSRPAKRPVTVHHLPVMPPAPEVKQPDTSVITSLVVLPDRVQPGSTVGVIATIMNTGKETSQHRAEFKVNQRLESVNDIMLEPGQSGELTFMTVAGPPGDYTISVDSAHGFLKVIPFTG